SMNSSSARTGCFSRPSGPGATRSADSRDEGPSPRSGLALASPAGDDAEAAAHALAPQGLDARLEQLTVGAAAQSGFEDGHGLVLASDGVQDRRLLVVEILE